jgi:hypothetical protein
MKDNQLIIIVIAQLRDQLHKTIRIQLCWLLGSLLTSLIILLKEFRIGVYLEVISEESSGSGPVNTRLNNVVIHPWRLVDIRNGLQQQARPYWLVDTISDEAMLHLIKERLGVMMIHLPTWKDSVLTQLKWWEGRRSWCGDRRRRCCSCGRNGAMPSYCHLTDWT